MSAVSFQTIRLSKGKHASPAEGACVMELASMLAGEEFSDHPRSVCPVIGALLRPYNDLADDDSRQELYAWASRIVGSHASGDVESLRAERLRARASELQPRRWTRFFSPRRLAVGFERGGIDALGDQTARMILKHSDRSHAEVTGLVDELLAIGMEASRTTAQRVAPSLAAETFDVAR